MRQIPATPTVNDLPPIGARARVREKYLSAFALAVAGSMLCAPSAAEWRVIQSEAAHFVEFDPGAMRESPPFRLAWTRVTFTTPQSADGQTYQSQGQLHA